MKIQSTCRDAINRVPTKQKRKNIRLEGWDYADNGWYFVTICVKDHRCVFGEITNGELRLNDTGKMVQKFWEEIPQHFENIELDEFIVMPNHIHGIIVIENGDNNGICHVQPSTNHTCRDMPWHVPKNKFGSSQKGSLAMIINHFKGTVTRWCKNNNLASFSWQPRFYDHIIRDEKSLDKIRTYVHFNMDILNCFNNTCIMHRSSSRTFPLLQVYRINFRRFFYFEIFRAKAYKWEEDEENPKYFLHQ